MLRTARHHACRLSSSDGSAEENLSNMNSLNSSGTRLDSHQLGNHTLPANSGRTSFCTLRQKARSRFGKVRCAMPAHLQSRNPQKRRDARTLHPASRRFVATQNYACCTNCRKYSTACTASSMLRIGNTTLTAHLSSSVRSAVRHLSVSGSTQMKPNSPV